MKAKLTHEEACELVEDSIKRLVAELCYLRGHNPTSLRAEVALNKANVLENMYYYGAYLKGARAMYLALKDRGFLEQPAKGRIINNAMLKAYMESTRNMEWLLEGLPESIELHTVIERDSKGKPKSAKSRFVKKEVEFKEV